MYYSSGNYEAFAHPAKPEGIENKSAYLIGTGLAGLSAACYLVRDAQMDGSRVHLFERDAEPGGACDGWDYPQIGFTMRGGREMDNHFEVMWDLFRSIPSIEDESMSVLDYYYQLNKRDPNYSLCRATLNQGEDANLENKFNLSDKACLEIMTLFFTPESQLDDKPITAMEMNPLEKLALHKGIEKLKGTDLHGLLTAFGVIPPDPADDTPAPATGAVYPGIH
ncbi:MAG: oleate hydratase [Gordonibacter sp.]|uniref:oleate hydratase n=1 Tax=Gordonibacter sp. TaxID=1968902 RepID=UPI002FC8AAA4